MASNKFVPANPTEVMVIRELTPNVLICSVPFLRAGKIPMGGRGTIVKMSAGGLAVFSPVALTSDVKAKLASWAPGQPVRYLIATDAEHHLFLSEWAKEHPGAKLVGVEGMPARRLKMSDPRVGREPFQAVFDAANARSLRLGPRDLDVDFEYEYMSAHANKELVFFYRPDRLLIQADLLFNLPATEQYSRTSGAEGARAAAVSPGGLAGLVAGWLGTAGEGLAQKRFNWYVASRPNRAAFTESIKRIAAWDFVTIVPCHGDVIEGNGKAVFERMFDWFLTTKK